MMVARFGAEPVGGVDASIFICDQSYGNSRPQSRHTTVSPGDGRCSCAAPQLAADGDGEAAPFVPTTEDHVQQTHRALLD